MHDFHTVITHRVHPAVTEELRRCGRVFTNEAEESLDLEALKSRAAGADALMVFMPDRIDEAFLACCPGLKLVACALKGYDNIDVAACTARGIWVSIVPDLLTAPTADLAIALLLALTRNILQGNDLVRNNAFTGWRPALYGSGLQGKKAGVVGFGRLGRAIARRLKAFDLDVCFFDPHSGEEETPDGAATRVLDLDQLVHDSDYLVLAAPLTANTFHLFDRRRLSRLKPGAYIVNVGRGSVVDESALTDTLLRGLLAGYGADVFEMEDLSLPDRPRAIPSALLRSSGNTIFTPHLGSGVAEVRLAIEMAAAANILDVSLGKPPRNAVNRV